MNLEEENKLLKRENNILHGEIYFLKMQIDSFKNVIKDLLNDEEVSFMETPEFKACWWWVKENEKQLNEKYDGKFLIINNCEVAGVYNKSIDALQAADDELKLERGKYVIHEALYPQRSIKI